MLCKFTESGSLPVDSGEGDSVQECCGSVMGVNYVKVCLFSGVRSELRNRTNLGSSVIGHNFS